MTRFSTFTDDELDMMEEAFCNEGLKSLVFEIRKERSLRRPVGSQESEEISECNMKMWEEIFKAESEG